jgi:serine/threonine protein kinase
MGCGVSTASKDVVAPVESTPAESCLGFEDSCTTIDALINTRTQATERLDSVGFECINNYVLLSKLGSGNYGVVYLAIDEQSGNQAAIKKVHRAPHHFQPVPTDQLSVSCDSGHYSSSTDYVRQEVELMKSLRHKHIIALYEVIDDPTKEHVYMIMQYANRGALARMDSAGCCTRKIASPLLLRYLEQAVAGLRYLHRHGVVHRDIKPENILLDSEDRLYLADFGVSCSLANPSRRTKGTPLFFAPELFAEQHPQPSCEADIWALGVTFYALLVGRAPFRGYSFNALARSVMNDPLSFPEDVPRFWQQLLSAMLNRDKHTRITSQSLRALLRRRNLRTSNEANSEFESSVDTDLPQRVIAAV